MNSVLKQIEAACSNAPIQYDSVNFNHYMLTGQGPDKTKAAYCFGVPIYNRQTQNIVDMKFLHQKACSSFLGSNASIRIRDLICLQNEYGRCDIYMPGVISKKTEDSIFWESSNAQIEVLPTLNGLAMKVFSDSCEFSLSLKIDINPYSIKANGSCIAILREKFVPFITVSCIGELDSFGNIAAPCKVAHCAISDREYRLTFTCNKKQNCTMMFEINMQANKLFQDTTVESKHPQMNNAFGGVAFLGMTDAFGEQYLYSRLELSLLPQLESRKLVKAILHIPEFSPQTQPLTINRIATRFCSFGTNWENKVLITDALSESTFSNGYQHLDITELICHIRRKSENFVIRAKKPNQKPVIISTGDNLFKPQILEVKFK